jgi:DNA-binding NarL/FixJ family response regulator
MNRRQQSKKPPIRVVVVDSDPLRFVGFRALLESERDIELIYASVSDLNRLEKIDVILLSNPGNNNSFDDVARLKATYPDLQIIAIGSGMREETILTALASGARGYVSEAASSAEFIRAIRVVSQGSLWVSRWVLSMFVERATRAAGGLFFGGRVVLTPREREVLEMLVEGRSNKEIGGPLGIEVRTVKAHVAKLMRKVGVRNRIALSTYAIVHSLVCSGPGKLAESQ